MLPFSKIGKSAKSLHPTAQHIGITKITHRDITHDAREKDEDVEDGDGDEKRALQLSRSQY